MSKLALFCLITAFACIQGCTNFLSIDKVDVWVHKRLNSEKNHGTKIQGTNFYLLDIYRYIDVTRANVSELCANSIKNFPVLEQLLLINVGLGRIESGAFDKVPKLSHLSLAVNRLTEIKRDAFSSIPRLAFLYLSGNQINHIEEGTFAQMANLKEVHLDLNRLASVNGNLFHGSPLIRRLDFSSNDIAEITEAAFRDVRPASNRPVHIRLTNNKIRIFDPKSLDELPAVFLHLEKNQINIMSIIFHNLKANSKLFMNNNNIQCIPDDVLETMRDTTIDVYVLNNPIDCQCLNRPEEIIGEEAYGKGTLYYNSTINCNIPRSLL